MLVRHPAILEAMSDYERAEHELALAVAEQYPDIDLGPGYFFDQGDDVWSMVGGLVLPVLADQTAPIAAAEATRALARARFEAVQADAVAVLQTSHARAESLREVLADAERLLRGTEAARDALAKRRTEGAVNRLTVARASIQVLSTALDVARIRARCREALFELEFDTRSAIFDAAFDRYLVDLNAELRTMDSGGER
jgi:outer membrane protein TolC